MRNIGSKLFVFFVVAAIVVGLGYAFLPEPVEVDLVTVERGNVRVTVDEDGKTRIREKYVVSAPLNGRILRISLDPGDPVVAGETLLTTIEPRDPELLDARSIAQAEARVKAAEAALRQSEPMLAKARADQAFDEAELARIRQAYRGNAVSQSDVESAEFSYRQSSEDLRAARIAEEISRFELQQAEAALMRSRPRTTEDSPIPSPGSAGGKSGDEIAGEAKQSSKPNGANGWNFPIYSPISGRVLRVFQESSAVVTPGTPLVELGDPEDLEVEIDVLSRDAVQINPGDLVLFEHWGGQKPLEGRVSTIEPSGFTKISTLGVEEQRVWVIADLIDPLDKREALGDGFRVEARIVTDEAKSVLKVPTSSLFRSGGDYAVFKVEEGVARERVVKIGRQNGMEAEVIEGLQQGDQIVLHPSDQIEKGTAVRGR